MGGIPQHHAQVIPYPALCFIGRGVARYIGAEALLRLCQGYHTGYMLPPARAVSIGIYLPAGKPYTDIIFTRLVSRYARGLTAAAFVAVHTGRYANIMQALPISSSFRW